MVQIVRDLLGDRVAQRARVRGPAKGQLDRPHRRRGDRERQRAVGIEAADQERRRAADRRQRDLAICRAAFQRGNPNIDLAKQVARCQAISLVAGDEVDDRNPLLAAAGLPDGADAGPALQ
ncbi:hypothetical protein ABH975_002579 [Bradyrhizobium ottawaense]